MRVYEVGLMQADLLIIMTCGGRGSLYNINYV